jgi:hypothetical protein
MSSLACPVRHQQVRHSSHPTEPGPRRTPHPGGRHRSDRDRRSRGSRRRRNPDRRRDTRTRKWRCRPRKRRWKRSAGGVLTNSPFVDREYVYVPSGASGYVDEFICQIDRYQDLWYILQDVNYNVIALTDSGGEVVRQHTFDPYGEILTAEDFDTHPGIKVGHQGLFFDRLEPSAPAGGLISMSAAVQLQPGVFGLYQARNRVLLPRYGRWAQKDPNASGMLHGALWHDGQAPMPELAAGSLSSALTDGSNLFALVRSNPFNSTDPTGQWGLGGMAFTTKIQATLRGATWGAAIGGVIGGVGGGALAAYDGDNVWMGIGKGALIGASGGAAGGLVGFAVAGAGSGITAGLVAAGAVDGATAAMIETLLEGGSYTEVMQETYVGAIQGGLTAGIVDKTFFRIVSKLKARWSGEVTKAAANGNNLMGVMSTTSGKMELDTVPSGVRANGRHQDLAERVGFEPWNDGKIGFSLESAGRHGTFKLRVDSGQVNATNPNLGGNRQLPNHVKKQLSTLLQEAFGITIE